MKIIAITLLFVASIAVFLGLGLVLPVLVTRVLGLGIDVPSHLDRTARVYGPLSCPWISLLAGLLVLSAFGWGIWKLTR